MKTWLFITISLTAALFFAGCAMTYDKTTELFGKRKKDVLIDRVVAARDAELRAKDQFAATLDAIRSASSYRGTALETEYSTLNSQYNRCQSQTDAVESALDNARRAAKSLFHQWEDELDQYSNATVRRSSEEKLMDMKSRYESVLYAMEKARDKCYPALTAIKDQVLLVRHNLNAQAEMSFGEETSIAEKEITATMLVIDNAAAEADGFIRQMRIEGE